MLSYPKDREENLDYRTWVMQEADENPQTRQNLLERCSHDLLFYVNTFVWTYNPKKETKVVPFVTWPFQDEGIRVVLAHIKAQRDLVIEKTREVGASWFCCLIMEWLWHFQAWQQFLMISRNAALVDSKSPDSLFWKIDFIHTHLPEWLRPNMSRTKMHFENEANGSTITGQATTEKAGIGGRATAMFLDEFSRVDDGFEVLNGTADTASCRIFNSTHTGVGNAFYGLTTNGVTDKLRMHWSDHPEKNQGMYRYDPEQARIVPTDLSFGYPANFSFVMDGKLRSPWYDAECARGRSARAIAMDLDIDPRGAMSQFFDAQLIQTLVQTYACPPYWEGDVSFDPDTGRPLALVRASGGPLRLWTHLRSDGSPAPALYAGGADVSTGTGRTNSCLAMANARTGDKVLEYTTPHLRPEQFALRVVALARFFRSDTGDSTLLAWEMQGPGVVFGKKVIDLGFRNVFYRISEQKLAPKVEANSPGWFPSPDNKRLLLEEYHAALSLRHFVNRSRPALEECLLFTHLPGGQIAHGEEESPDDPSGARVSHADRVIADALCWKMCKSLGAGKPLSKPKEPERPANPYFALSYRRLLADNAARAAQEY